MIQLISIEVIYSLVQILPTSFRSRVGDGAAALPNLIIEYSSGTLNFFSTFIYCKIRPRFTMCSIYPSEKCSYQLVVIIYVHSDKIKISTFD